jgi:hypothetical protein
MAAQWMGRAAMRRDDAEDPGRGTATLGRAAAGAAYLRDQSRRIVAKSERIPEATRLRPWRRAINRIARLLARIALGTLSYFGRGFRLNLGVTSAAQREAFRARDYPASRPGSGRRIRRRG